MSLTHKGKEIMGAMKKEYGSKKGEEVFYASANAGKIHGVDPKHDSRDDDVVKSYLESVRRGDSAGMETHRNRFRSS